MDRADRVYGTAEPDLDAMAAELAAYLGQGEKHESFFLGGDYYLWKIGTGEVKLRTNRELEDDLAEPDYPDAKLILYVEAVGVGPDWDELAMTVGFRRLTSN